MLTMISFTNVLAEEISSLTTKQLPALEIGNKKFERYIEFEDQSAAEEYLTDNYEDVINKINANLGKTYTINDKKFQLATFSLDVLNSTKEVEFRRYIDVYENKEKNDRIALLVNQLSNSENAIEEQNIIIELETLVPADLSIVDKPISNTSSSLYRSPYGISLNSLSTYSNGYNREVAKNYAKTWAKARNNAKKYQITRVGIVLEDSITSYYDEIPYAQAILTGSW